MTPIEQRIARLRIALTLIANSTATGVAARNIALDALDTDDKEEHR